MYKSILSLTLFCFLIATVLSAGNQNQYQEKSSKSNRNPKTNYSKSNKQNRNYQQSSSSKKDNLWEAAPNDRSKNRTSNSKTTNRNNHNKNKYNNPQQIDHNRSGKNQNSYRQNPNKRVNSRQDAAADRNNDGYIDRHEANKRNQHFDINNDGHISHREKQFTNTQNDKYRVDSKWEERVDRNNDGIVDQKEMQKHIQKMDRNRSNNFNQNNMRSNGANTNNTQQVKSHSRGIPDLNKDGFVDDKEMQMHKQNTMSPKDPKQQQFLKQERISGEYGGSQKSDREIDHLQDKLNRVD
jgi:hypothetical protein